MRARLTLIYSARGSSSPAALRMRYLAEALRERGVEVEEVVLPQKRLAYLSFGKIFKKNVVYSVPPAFVALRVKSEESVADVRDPWDVYVKESRPLKRMLSAFVVKRYLNALAKTRFMVTTTKSIATHYRRLLGKEVYVIENGSDTELLKCQNSKREKKAVIVADFRNPYLPLEPFFKVARSLLPVKLIGPGSEKFGGLGSIDYARLPEVCCSASIGVIPRPWRGNTYKMTIPLKTYDYMALGLCIFAYGPPGSELESLITSHKIGVYASSEEQMEEKLEECLEVSEEAGARARELAVKRYDRKKLSARYADLLLDRLLNSSQKS